MKQRIRLTESELHRLIMESVENAINDIGIEESDDWGQSLNEEDMDEGWFGMGAGLMLRPIVNKVINFITGKLNLDQNGVLYRVLTSRLFAMSLGNEIQNSMKLKKNGGGMQGGNALGGGNIMQMLGIGGSGMGGNMMGGMGTPALMGGQNSNTMGF